MCRVWPEACLPSQLTVSRLASQEKFVAAGRILLSWRLPARGRTVAELRERVPRADSGIQAWRRVRALEWRGKDSV